MYIYMYIHRFQLDLQLQLQLEMQMQPQRLFAGQMGTPTTPSMMKSRDNSWQLLLVCFTKKHALLSGSPFPRPAPAFAQYSALAVVFAYLLCWMRLHLFSSARAPHFLRPNVRLLRCGELRAITNKMQNVCQSIWQIH